MWSTAPTVTGIAHVILGKVSFTAEQLAENYGAVYERDSAYEAGGPPRAST